LGVSSGKPYITVYNQAGKNLASSYTRRVLWQTLRQSGFQGLKQLANPHSGLLGDLISAIEENREPLASGQSGRDAVALVLSIYQSALEKKDRQPASQGIRFDQDAAFLFLNKPISIR